MSEKFRIALDDGLVEFLDRVAERRGYTIGVDKHTSRIQALGYTISLGEAVLELFYDDRILYVKNKSNAELQEIGLVG